MPGASDTAAQRRPLLLKVLLQEKHWQEYGLFCRAYNKAAAQLDREAGVTDHGRLAGGHPTRSQYFRWISGSVGTLPYPRHRLVLEKMFPGYKVEQLFSPVNPEEEQATAAPIDDAPSAIIVPAGIHLAPFSNATRSETGNLSGWFDSSWLGLGDSKREISQEDAEIVREMVRTFRRLDNRFGGGRVRPMVNGFLTSEIAPILHSSIIRWESKDEFYGAVAELQQLAGWIAYDTGDRHSGLRHLRHGLRLSNEVSDYARSSEMLSGMSHQAAFYRSPDLALEYAEAAKREAKKSGLPLLETESLVMEAHALAMRGDAARSREALNQAEALFTHGNRAEHPEWLTYFDEAYMAAKFAHCFSEVGDWSQAEKYARRSLVMSEGYDRGRLFNTALLAMILIDKGDLDEACALFHSALQMARSVDSVRTNKYLSLLAQKLAPYSSHHAARVVLERYKEEG